MSRYTEAQLLELIGQVNRLTKSPERPMSEIWVEQWRVGHYHLKRGRDGYMLARITSDAGEWLDVFGAGWMTKPELGMRLESFILGLEEAREVWENRITMAWV